MRGLFNCYHYRKGKLIDTWQARNAITDNGMKEFLLCSVFNSGCFPLAFRLIDSPTGDPDDLVLDRTDITPSAEPELDHPGWIETSHRFANFNARPGWNFDTEPEAATLANPSVSAFTHDYTEIGSLVTTTGDIGRGFWLFRVQAGVMGIATGQSSVFPPPIDSGELFSTAPFKGSGGAFRRVVFNPGDVFAIDYTLELTGGVNADPGLPPP